ncbi:mucin-2-like [Planococcus citri]|uniref:mucin-2-like n=1 Tax=Planococcus citri TaxID=170843 RepID=UPI0031F765D3
MSSSEVLRHNRSGLLSAEDNELIFKLVGQACQTLSTTVIELHRNLGPKGEGDWSKEEVGVLCLVRDLIKKCHFFRIFCLIRKRKVWEYVIHNRMRYSTPDPFLHFFQVEDCTYAFYFVSEQEAAQMHEILVQVLDNYDRKPNVTEYDKIHEINPLVESPSKSTLKLNGNGGNRENVGRRLLNFGKQFRRFKMFSKKDDEEKRKKAPKFDISPPRDFKHVSHICDFKERMSQIKTGDMWNDKMSLMNPLSTSTSTSISSRTIGHDTSIAPPLPEKKSPRFDHRVLAADAAKFDFGNKKNNYLHASQASDTAPPLPEKKSPRPARREPAPMQYQFNASFKPSSPTSKTAPQQSPTYRSLDEDGNPFNRPSISAANTSHRVSTSTSICFGNDRMQCDFTATLSPSNALKNSPRLARDSSRFKFPGEDNFRSEELPDWAENTTKSSRLNRQYSIPKPYSVDSGHYNIIEAARRSVVNDSVCPPISSPSYSSSNEKNTHRRASEFPLYQNFIDESINSPHVFLVENKLPKKYEYRNHVTRSPPPPYIVSAELKPSAGLIEKSYLNCSSNDVSASTYETLPPPRPVTKNNSHKSEPATTQCVYDVVTAPPRPIIAPPPALDASSCNKVEEQTSSNLNSRTNTTSVNYRSQTCAAENVRKMEPKPYAMNTPTTAHQYLPSSCSTVPSNRFPDPKNTPTTAHQYLPSICSIVPSNRFPDAKNTPSTAHQYLPSTCSTVPSNRFPDTKNSPTTAHQYLPSTCSTVSSNRFPDTKNSPTTAHQYLPSACSTVPSNRFPDAMNTPTTAHQYLPSTCPTVPSNRFHGHRALPVSLIADINRGVKLKPVERK